MKPKIIFPIYVIILILLSWYNNLNEVTIYNFEKETILCETETYDLFNNKIIKHNNPDYIYRKKRNGTVKRTRSNIPFVFNRDTVSDSGIKYTFEKKK